MTDKRLILKNEEQCRVSFALTLLEEVEGPGFRGMFPHTQGQWKTVVVVWPVDEYGCLDQRKFKTDWRVRTLVISQDTLNWLSAFHKEWDLGYRDFRILCADAFVDPQVLRPTPCKDSLFQKILGSPNPKIEVLREALLFEVRELLPDACQERIEWGKLRPPSGPDLRQENLEKARVAYNEIFDTILNGDDTEKGLEEDG